MTMAGGGRRTALGLWSLLAAETAALMPVTNMVWPIGSVSALVKQIVSHQTHLALTGALAPVQAKHHRGGFSPAELR